jgi:hypothetical protein
LSVHHATSIRRGEELLVDWESIVCRLFRRRLSTRIALRFQKPDASATIDSPRDDGRSVASTTRCRFGRRGVDCLSILSAAAIYADLSRIR